MGHTSLLAIGSALLKKPLCAMRKITANLSTLMDIDSWLRMKRGSRPLRILYSQKWRNPFLFGVWDSTHGEQASLSTEANHGGYNFWALLMHMPSPGRFFASGMLKLMVAHVLLTYDIRFADESQKRTFCWRSAIVPSSKSAILFRERHAWSVGLW